MGEICADDVDEAIRLTKASKSSLEDETLHQEDPTSAIFSIIKDAIMQKCCGVASSSEAVPNMISFDDVEARVVHKGFTIDQMKKAIEEYTSLNVIAVDGNFTHISML